MTSLLQPLNGHDATPVKVAEATEQEKDLARAYLARHQAEDVAELLGLA